jgi:glutaconate CoA-transferase subunit A
LLALAEAGISDIQLVSLTGSIETDMAVGLGLARTVRSSFISLGLHGLAPEVGRAREEDRVDVPLETEMTIVGGLKAAISGLGFFPMRAWDATDMSAGRPDIKMVECPYTHQLVVAFPALPLDVAFVHAAYADRSGNCVLSTDLAIDIELLRAAHLRIVTVEEIVEDDDLLEFEGHIVPAFDVDVIIEVPGGAKPTGCNPHYGPDWAAFDQYISGADRRIQELQSYVHQVTQVETA